MMSVALQRPHPFNADFMEVRVQENVGDVPVLSSFLLRNPCLKLTGVLEHCRQREPTVG
jgi:hypothetical protein